ncbi:hypothetical protein JW921_08365 [Candidatus Fermentibacterales bacterium]|nr:hypothetical protein [Candidatus Fermentibacterales bacterium]
MLPLLLPVLMDTVICEPDYNVVRVHELGVVVFREGCDAAARGAPEWGDANVYLPEEDRAPIVFFHGIPFTGDFRVEAPGGSLTAIWPEPSRTVIASSADSTNPMPVFSATWQGIEAGLLFEQGYVPVTPCPNDLPFAWAVSIWRQVPALPLRASDSSWTEMFIYYEANVGPFFRELAAGAGEKDFDILDYYRGEALLFHPPGRDWPKPADILVSRVSVLDGTISMRGTGPQTYDEMSVIEELLRWSLSEIEPEEAQAFWQTWEESVCDPWAEDGWLLFPLPQDMVWGMTTIELTTEQAGRVEYHRLVLGLVSPGLERFPEALQ